MPHGLCPRPMAGLRMEWGVFYCHMHQESATFFREIDDGKMKILHLGAIANILGHTNPNPAKKGKIDASDMHPSKRSAL
jgi:hypothetical protein